MKKLSLNLKNQIKPPKPLLRGHFHQAAFFFFFGACMILLYQSKDFRTGIASLIYSLGVISLFGISAIYHRPQWSLRARALMRRFDHAAIFLLIAGTATPICLLGISGAAGQKLLWVVWIAATVGILQSIFWITAPKWLKAAIYVVCGWLALPYLNELKANIGWNILSFIIAGGVIYTVGAVIYALKRPNPWPRVFGYHEIFHILVIIAAGLHFWAILNMINL